MGSEMCIRDSYQQRKCNGGDTVMNNDKLLQKIIQKDLGDVFNRFSDISPSDRYYLMNEHLETILNDYDRDDILLVPDNMKLKVKKRRKNK